MHKASLVLALALGTYGVTALAQPALKSDQDKTLYAIGMAVGKNLQSLGLTATELKLVQSGLGDAVLGHESRVDMQAYGPRIQEFAQKRAQDSAAHEKTASAAYLEKMAKTPHAVKTQSGLIYIPITEGTGASPKATDKVRVSYEGKLRDGTVFDSSKAHGQPVSFPLNGVIACWTEGLQKMKVGGTSELICPASLAYGEQGSGPIPGGAVLDFKVELLGIE